MGHGKSWHSGTGQLQRATCSYYQHTTVQGEAVVLHRNAGCHAGCAAGSSWLQLILLFPQGFILLPKTKCDVREVEFARCLRLRQTSLEPVAFRLPRVRVRLGPRIPAPNLLFPLARDFSPYLAMLPNLPALCSLGILAPYFAAISELMDAPAWGVRVMELDTGVL